MPNDNLVMQTHTNSDPAELAKFSDLAHRWWDKDSEFRPLHQINPLRLAWIADIADLKGKRVLHQPFVPMFNHKPHKNALAA